MNIMHTEQKQFVEDVREVANALRDIKVVEDIVNGQEFLALKDLRGVLRERKEAIISLFAKDYLKKH